MLVISTAQVGILLCYFDCCCNNYNCHVAAGYALHQYACCSAYLQGTHGFTLDPLCGEFLLTHPNVKIPQRGQIYSVNDARFHDWPKGLQAYIDTIRQGKGQNPKQYSARYICSLVGDFHRTLLYGGQWLFMPYHFFGVDCVCCFICFMPALHQAGQETEL
jgi:fructose-1,6-bisphosphatase